MAHFQNEISKVLKHFHSNYETNIKAKRRVNMGLVQKLNASVEVLIQQQFGHVGAFQFF